MIIKQLIVRRVNIPKGTYFVSERWNENLKNPNFFFDFF